MSEKLKNSLNQLVRPLDTEGVRSLSRVSAIQARVHYRDEHSLWAQTAQESPGSVVTRKPSSEKKKENEVDGCIEQDRNQGRDQLRGRAGGALRTANIAVLHESPASAPVSIRRGRTSTYRGSCHDDPGRAFIDGAMGHWIGHDGGLLYRRLR